MRPARTGFRSGRPAGKKQKEAAKPPRTRGGREESRSGGFVCRQRDERIHPSWMEGGPVLDSTSHRRGDTRQPPLKQRLLGRRYRECRRLGTGLSTRRRRQFVVSDSTFLLGQMEEEMRINARWGGCNVACERPVRSGCLSQPARLCHYQPRPGEGHLSVDQRHRSKGNC